MDCDNILHIRIEMGYAFGYITESIVTNSVGKVGDVAACRSALSQCFLLSTHALSLVLSYLFLPGTLGAQECHFSIPLTFFWYI